MIVLNLKPRHSHFVGSRLFVAHYDGEIQQGKDENEPVAIGTHFGYMLSGPVSNTPQTLLSWENLSCTHVLPSVTW